MKVFLIIFLIVLTCCDSPHIENPYALPQKDSLIMQVNKKTFIQLKKDSELYPFGTAGKAMNQIKTLGLSLRYYKPVDIEKSRELLVHSTTLFLSIINDNKDIIPYLEKYPFTPENIEIRIYLQTPNASEPDSGKLSIVKMRNGILEYVIRNPETELFVTFYKETFEEAKAKLYTKVSI